jgi:molybdate transport system substrate-binding protein
VVCRLGLLVLALVSGLRAGEAPAFTVAAAASLGKAMDEAMKAHAQAGGAPGQGTYAAASTLAKQIEQGSPVHLFMSADQRWMDWLAERRLIDPASRTDIAANRLVLIAPADAPFTATLAKGSDLAATIPGRWATGDPAHVPVGAYARQSLTWLGAWDALQPRLIATADVRAALRTVELGEASAGIVYATDARSSAKVAVVGTFPVESHTPITYPAALVCTGNPAAGAFLDFLRGPGGQAVLARHGFLPVGATAAAGAP